MAHPTTVLRWADTPTTLRTEPSEPTKNTGFSVNGKLPAQFFNWISGVTGDWITWLAGVVDNGVDFTLKPDTSGGRDIGAVLRPFGDGFFGGNVYGTHHIATEYVKPTSSIDSQLTAVSGTMSVTNGSGTLLAMRGTTPGSSTSEFATVDWVENTHVIPVAAAYGITGLTTQMPIAAGGPSATTPLNWNLATMEINKNVTFDAGGTWFTVPRDGIYHVDVWAQWDALASATIRTLQVQAPLVTKNHFLSGLDFTWIIASQAFGFDFLVTDHASQTIAVSAATLAGGGEYLDGFGMSLHFVSNP